MPLEGPRFVDAAGQLVRGTHFLVAVGRLAPGVSVAQADAEAAALAATLAERHPDTNRGWGGRVVALHEQTVGAVRPALLTLLAGVVVLLLMAMVNVANLMLARGLVRQRELAVRAALGARPLQLVRQVLAEGMLLAAGGAIVSLAAVRWLVDGLIGFAPPSFPRIAEVAPDGSVVVAAAVLAVVAGAVIGLLPISATARPDVPHRAPRRRPRLRRRVVARPPDADGAGRSAQVALAAVLAVQAGLLTRSFAALLALDPGFQADHLLTLQMGAPDHLASAEARRAFYQRVLRPARRLARRADGRRHDPDAAGQHQRHGHDPGGRPSASSRRRYTSSASAGRCTTTSRRCASR